MKVIDLLNMIANGEEVPKFYVDDNSYVYYFDKGFLRRYKEGIREFTDDVVEWNIYRSWLSRGITFIEEKKIPEKIKDKYCSQISKVELAQKYNEIIDYLKSKGDE